MGGTTEDKIIDAIKSDDLVLFSEYVKGKENLAYGRFPLLSLSYLYGAKKIVRKYKDALGLIKKYKQVEERFEFFEALKKVAGKKIRLCLSDNIISPLVMLALMGKTRELKKCYTKFYVDDAIKENIISAYGITAQSVDIEEKKISVSKRPLGAYSRKSMMLSAIVSGVMVVALSLTYVITGLVVGFGYGGSNFKVSNLNSLLRALNSSSSYELTKDLTIDGEIKDLSFGGTLDGKGHTIYVSDLYDSLILVNAGTIKNLNIVYRLTEASKAQEISLLVGENKGTISGVQITIVCDNINFEKGENDVGLYGFSIDNSGAIRGCEILIKLNVSTTLDGECGISGFAKNNSGIINNCNVLNGSKIEAHNADVSGIALNNDFDGEISFCENRAELKQTSDKDGWSPNVSGICQQNKGTIGTCTNYGNLNNISSNDKNDVGGAMYVGGITAINYGVIDNCYSAGDINATTNVLSLYAGGIVAYSYYLTDEDKNVHSSSLLGCGVKGNISLETSADSAFVYAGGISGFAWGEIDKCFSSASFSQGFTQEKYFIGTLLGEGVCTTSYNIFTGSEYVSGVYFVASDCYVLSASNVEYNLGLLLASSGSKVVGVNYSSYITLGSITTVSSLDMLKECEVYYDR